MELTLKPIAFVESCFRDRFAVPRQPLLVKDAWAFLRFQSSTQPELSLQGLEGYSHLWVIFGFHLNKSSRFHAKVHPPRLEGKTMGLFATRTPHRPNPVGLSLVTIKSLRADGIEITGGDLADGTPIYDIKPYIPEIEAVPEALGGWSSQVSKPAWSVVYATPELEERVMRWGETIKHPQLIEIIRQTLQQDPRPLVYRDKTKEYKDSHAFRLFNGDVHFREQDGVFVVTEIKIFN